MAKQSINVSTANSGLGDPLRTAFVKINSNFTELYAALGLDAGGLNLGAFQFSGSVMSTTDSTPIVLNQAVSVTGDLTVGGDLLPNNDLQVNLGSPSKKWHSLYVGTGSVYIGDARLSLEGGTLNSSVGFSTDSLIIGGNVLTVNSSGAIQSTGGIEGGAGGSSTDRLTNGSNEAVLNADGSLSIGSNSVRISTNGYITAVANVNTVIYTATVSDLGSIRVHATIEGQEVGDTTGYHTQACDMMIVRRISTLGVSTVDSVVYGVIYTGAGPLATLDAQWNATTSKIEITATPVSTTNNVFVKIYATEVARGD